MSKPFDMDLFLAGVLTGSNATRQRHIRQANAIQMAISERWKKASPWTWKRKHLLWFLNHQISDRADATRYYYTLTALLIATRLDAPWLSDAWHLPKNIQSQPKKGLRHNVSGQTPAPPLQNSKLLAKAAPHQHV